MPEITDIEKLSNIVRDSQTLTDVLRFYNICENGRERNKLKILFEKNNISTTHFKFVPSNKKYGWIEKICPVCDNTFTTKSGSKHEKTVCSMSCSNTYFRSEENNPNWIDGKSLYRQICFKYHEHKCVVCDETIIVAVHHFDGNKKNDGPENLIPLCPTHHTYWHSKHRHIIEQKVIDYIENWKLK